MSTVLYLHGSVVLVVHSINVPHEPRFDVRYVSNADVHMWTVLMFHMCHVMMCHVPNVLNRCGGWYSEPIRYWQRIGCGRPVLLIDIGMSVLRSYMHQLSRPLMCRYSQLRAPAEQTSHVSLFAAACTSWADLSCADIRSCMHQLSRPLMCGSPKADYRQGAGFTKIYTNSYLHEKLFLNDGCAGIKIHFYHLFCKGIWDRKFKNSTVITITIIKITLAVRKLNENTKFHFCSSCCF